MVRHVKIIIMSYQWLNVETKERLSSVRKCREQWRGTAARGLLKCPGPERFTNFFQNWFHVLHITSLNFMTEWMNIFLSFVLIQVLIDFSVLLFPGPSILTWGTLSNQLHMLQWFPLFLASLVMSQKNIWLKWFGRGNIHNILTMVNEEVKLGPWEVSVLLSCCSLFSNAPHK